MTENKKAAGYFDSVRNCPVYEGDVYFDSGLIDPYFRVVKTTDKGFLIHHVGSTETFTFEAEGKNLIKRNYIGNELDNPNVISDFTKAREEKGLVCALAENTAETSETTVSEEDEPTETAPEEKAVEEVVETINEVSAELEKGEEDESICSTDSDDTDAGLQNNTDESSTAETGTDNEGSTAEENDKSAEETGAVSAEATSNVIVETASKPVPDVIANTKEEKQAILRVQFLNKQITSNKTEIEQLQEKVEYHTHLASTLDYEPFIKLKNLVSEALHTNVDDENVKGIKERTKDFESIINIQNLLKEHQRLADKAEQDIADLEDENSKFEDEIADLNSKIDTFARQQKLPLDAANEKAETPEAKKEE